MDIGKRPEAEMVWDLGTIRLRQQENSVDERNQTITNYFWKRGRGPLCTVTLKFYDIA